MQRREFLGVTGALLSGEAALAAEDALPKYQVVTPYRPAARPGMPGLYPAQTVTVHSSKVIEEAGEKVDAAEVRRMIERGMCALTGDANPRDSWARFFNPSDVVGIKVNASGAPGIYSTTEIILDIVRNLLELGLPPGNVFLYERFRNQLDDIGYEKVLPKGVTVEAAEERRGSRNERYDPAVYVEMDFHGEDDTRSNMCRCVSRRATKIINVPNMKDHGASGVTGCLKNIAYGSFSNVARSHNGVKTNTYSLIGTLAAVEPLRSRVVLNIMDGIRGTWHGGPFSFKKQFRFFPKQIMFGTDPIAMDRLLIDIIEGKRKAEGANSVWDRSMANIKPGRGYDDNPNIHRFIRETGHIQYAARFGLGEYDIAKIRQKKVELG